MSAPSPRAAAVRTTAAAPADPETRLHLIDALRGFALLGIFLINVGDFGLFWAMPAESRAALPLGWTARLAEVSATLFVRGKFYTIFSFLFGLGFAMLLARGARRGDDVSPLYRRRLTILMIIGALHMTLLWHGDILALYAALGFVLMAFARASDRALVTWAAALFLLPLAGRAIVVASEGALDPGGPARTAARWLERRLLGEVTEADLLALLQSGDWLLLLKYNVTGPLFRAADLLSTMRLPRVLGAFLLGMWAGRHGVFQDPAAHAPLLRRALRWGLPIGLAANAVLAAVAEDDRAWHAPIRLVEDAAAVGIVPLALAYMAAFVLLWLRPFWRRWLSRLAPAGQMALTNYLAQSVIGILVFYGVGLGLGGRVGSAIAASIAAGVFLLQVAVSALWLRRYRYGPAEWLWRSLTYGRRQPFRRR